MVTIDGKAYAVGVHEINGKRIQVVDRSTFVTLGEAPPEPEPVRFEPLNVNTATAEELEALDGIGAAAAKRIIEGRPFEDLADLIRIKGVTQKTLDANRGLIVA